MSAPAPAPDAAARTLLRGDLAFGVDFIPWTDGVVAVVGAPSASAAPARATPEAFEPAPRGKAAPPPTAPAAVAVDASAGKAAALEALRRRHDAECVHCTTATAHTNTVFGEGNPEARLMFVGEAPGETEDRLGRPFVGRAGQKLDEMIQAMGLSRESVYIANVLKSRPPDNRTPLPDEVAGCGPWLEAQIRIIRPQVLVTLGGPATKLLLGTETGITRLRGIWAEWRPAAEPGLTIPVMPTYHPAYLLRNYTLKTRQEVWSDLLQVKERLAAAASGG